MPGSQSSKGYDPDLRRDTPLAGIIRERIRSSGPLRISEYQDLCLNHPDFGYYKTRRAIGADADFITAPEISQVFGEIIGLWCVVVWQQMGAPGAFRLVELGPGRGTLLSDALRAASKVPGFVSAAHICLVEQNLVLRDVQREALAGFDVSADWFGSIEELRNAAGISKRTPSIVIANEFLDVLPVEQLVLTHDGWRYRCVDLDDAGQLKFRIGEAVPPEEAVAFNLNLDPAAGAATGSIVTAATHLDESLREILSSGTFSAALFIDYGHDGARLCDTLQAMRNHAYEHPLTSPGEADLTSLVDFADVRKAMPDGFVVDGPITQAEFLGRLGIAERASRLMASNPACAPAIESGVARLLAPNGMGTRFKAIAIRSRRLPVLPGFEPFEPVR